MRCWSCAAKVLVITILVTGYIEKTDQNEASRIKEWVHATDMEKVYYSVLPEEIDMATLLPDEVPSTPSIDDIYDSIEMFELWEGEQRDKRMRRNVKVDGDTGSGSTTDSPETSTTDVITTPTTDVITATEDDIGSGTEPSTTQPTSIQTTAMQTEPTTDVSTQTTVMSTQVIDSNETTEGSGTTPFETTTFVDETTTTPEVTTAAVIVNIVNTRFQTSTFVNATTPQFRNDMKQALDLLYNNVTTPTARRRRRRATSSLFNVTIENAQNLENLTIDVDYTVTMDNMSLPAVDAVALLNNVTTPTYEEVVSTQLNTNITSLVMAAVATSTTTTLSPTTPATANTTAENTTSLTTPVPTTLAETTESGVTSGNTTVSAQLTTPSVNATADTTSPAPTLPSTTFTTIGSTANETNVTTAHTTVDTNSTTPAPTLDTTATFNTTNFATITSAVTSTLNGTTPSVTLSTNTTLPPSSTSATGTINGTTTPAPTTVVTSATMGPTDNATTATNASTPVPTTTFNTTFSATTTSAVTPTLNGTTPSVTLSTNTTLPSSSTSATGTINGTTTPAPTTVVTSATMGPTDNATTATNASIPVPTTSPATTMGTTAVTTTTTILATTPTTVASTAATTGSFMTTLAETTATDSTVATTTTAAPSDLNPFLDDVTKQMVLEYDYNQTLTTADVKVGTREALIALYAGNPVVSRRRKRETNMYDVLFSPSSTFGGGSARAVYIVLNNGVVLRSSDSAQRIQRSSDMEVIQALRNQGVIATRLQIANRQAREVTGGNVQEVFTAFDLTTDFDGTKQQLTDNLTAALTSVYSRANADIGITITAVNVTSAFGENSPNISAMYTVVTTGTSLPDDNSLYTVLLIADLDDDEYATEISAWFPVAQVVTKASPVNQVPDVSYYALERNYSTAGIQMDFSPSVLVNSSLVTEVLNQAYSELFGSPTTVQIYDFLMTYITYTVTLSSGRIARAALGAGTGWANKCFLQSRFDNASMNIEVARIAAMDYNCNMSFDDASSFFYFDLLDIAAPSRNISDSFLGSVNFSITFTQRIDSENTPRVCFISTSYVPTVISMQMFVGASDAADAVISELSPNPFFVEGLKLITNVSTTVSPLYSPQRNVCPVTTICPAVTTAAPVECPTTGPVSCPIITATTATSDTNTMVTTPTETPAANETITTPVTTPTETPAANETITMPTSTDSTTASIPPVPCILLWIFWVVVGLLILLVVILVIVIIILCHRWRRDKAKTQEDGSISHPIQRTTDSPTGSATDSQAGKTEPETVTKFPTIIKNTEAHTQDDEPPKQFPTPPPVPINQPESRGRHHAPLPDTSHRLVEDTMMMASPDDVIPKRVLTTFHPAVGLPPLQPPLMSERMRLQGPPLASELRHRSEIERHRNKQRSRRMSRPKHQLPGDVDPATQKAYEEAQASIDDVLTPRPPAVFDPPHRKRPHKKKGKLDMTHPAPDPDLAMLLGPSNQPPGHYTVVTPNQRASDGLPDTGSSNSSQPPDDTRRKMAKLLEDAFSLVSPRSPSNAIVPQQPPLTHVGSVDSGIFPSPPLDTNNFGSPEGITMPQPHGRGTKAPKRRQFTSPPMSPDDTSHSGDSPLFTRRQPPIVHDPQPGVRPLTYKAPASATPSGEAAYITPIRKTRGAGNSAIWTPYRAFDEVSRLESETDSLPHSAPSPQRSGRGIPVTPPLVNGSGDVRLPTTSLPSDAEMQQQIRDELARLTSQSTSVGSSPRS